MLDRNCIEMKLSYDEQYLILKHEKTIILIDVNTLETKEYEIEVPYDSQHDFDYYSKLKKLIITNRDVQIITLEPTPVYCKVLNPHKRNDYSNNYMLRIGSDKPLFLTCFQKVIKIWSLSNNKNIGQVICNHTINSANFVRNRNRLVASEYRSIHVYCLRTYRKIMSYYLNTGSAVNISTKHIESIKNLLFQEEFHNINICRLNVFARKIEKFEASGILNLNYEVLGDGMYLRYTRSLFEVYDSSEKPDKLKYLISDKSLERVVQSDDGAIIAVHNSQKILSVYKKDLILWSIKNMNISKMEFLGNTHLVTGAEGPRDVRIWNAETGEIVKMIETPTMHSFILIPNYFKISQNQDKFSYICSNVENRADKISIWDLKTKETVSNVITTVTRNAFITYEFCDDDKFLITASTDNKLNAWDLSSEKAEYKELGSFPETNDFVIIKADREERKHFFFYSGGEIQIWSVSSGKIKSIKSQRNSKRLTIFNFKGISEIEIWKNYVLLKSFNMMGVINLKSNEYKEINLHLSNFSLNPMLQRDEGNRPQFFISTCSLIYVFDIAPF